MSNQLTTTEERGEPQVNVINYNPVFPTLMAEVLLDLPVEDMMEDLLKLGVNEDNYSGGYTTYFNRQNIDNIRGVKELKDAIYGVSCSYCRELKFETDYDKCSIEVWANVMRKGGYHIPHHYNKKIVAGTFLVRSVEDMSPIVFHNPTSMLRGKEPVFLPKDATPFTAEKMVITPKVNTMLIWPAWMVHEIPKMEVSGPCISFSFNVDFLPVGV